MGKKIAMISALGGQGCTLTAAYVGQAMTDVGRNVAMLDMCGFGGTLAYVLGAAENSGFNAGDVFNGRCSQDEALVDCGTGLSVIASSAFSDETILPYGVEARRIVESLSREGDVIADMPSGTVPDCGAVRCFDMFVICARADDLSLKYAAAMRRLIENSAADCGCNCDVRLVLTQFSSEYLRISRVNDIDVCIDTVGARLLGIVPHDVTAAKAAMSGQALDTACEAMNYCRDIACRICGEKIPLDSKPSLFKKSLF